MFYPQASFNPQSTFYPQASFNPQTAFHPQGAAQGIFSPQGIGSFGSPGTFSQLGYQTPFAQGPTQFPNPTQFSNWQHPAQQQAALQLQALQQLQAHQLAMRPPLGLNGLSNGMGQSLAGWPQQQSGPEQINPLLQQLPPALLLSQLAQYHYMVAQQLSHIAQQAMQSSAGNFPFAPQFAPNQIGANFVPAGTMH
ncbi:MAG TPA: hypothetical protein VHS76_10765 [Steroidobacteraceae bacterium]|jgi:hypothetical protein|nr:hypothetical protein [Steroidobacteraceae bacterium]